ncbi:MAG: hypothetical protein ACYTHJ_06835 [Planctomycetota bacterium]
MAERDLANLPVLGKAALKAKKGGIYHIWQRSPLMTRESAARIPSYRLHKPTGRAVVRLDGRDFYLGRHGTDVSKERYSIRHLGPFAIGLAILVIAAVMYRAIREVGGRFAGVGITLAAGLLVVWLLGITIPIDPVFLHTTIAVALLLGVMAWTGNPGSNDIPVAGDNGPESFLQTTYKNGAFVRATLTLSDVLALRAGEVDCEINEVTGRISLQPKRGQVITYEGSIPGLGPDVGRPLLDTLMWQPGQVLTAHDLIRNPSLIAFNSSYVRASWLRRLRRAFGETTKDPWFFDLFSSPWRLRWNPDRSWRIVERCAS